MQNAKFLKKQKFYLVGDEKWAFCNNVKRKRSWTKKKEPAKTTSKPDIHQKIWVFKEIGYFEHFPDNTTINF